jgi:hypothetical protein
VSRARARQNLITIYGRIIEEQNTTIPSELLERLQEMMDL